VSKNITFFFFFTAAEGIPWDNISYKNNQEIIDLVSKKPNGLLILLEAQCMLNRVDSDDSALLASFNNAHAGNPCLERPRFGTKDIFIVKHFAGDVSYSVSGFMDKNNDALQEDLLTLMLCSTNPFVQNAIVYPATSDTYSTGSGALVGEPGFVPEISPDLLIPELDQVATAHSRDSQDSESHVHAPAEIDEEAATHLRKARAASRRTSLMAGASGGVAASAMAAAATAVASAGGTSNKKMASSVTVSGQFRNQLEVLMMTLAATSPRFITCIKPNALKKPQALDRLLVLEQMRYCGALEVVKMRQRGYVGRSCFFCFFL
jgi:myosin heavy subunit